MSVAVPGLPTDVETLQALVLATRAQLDSAIAERDLLIVERDAALSQNDHFRHLLRQLQRAQFGRHSEKLDPDQLLLAIEDTEQAIAANEAAADKTDPAAAKARAEKRRSNRGALPRHLPRVDETIEPEDINCPCCRSPMHRIGEEASERLDVIPAQFRVIVTHRPKFACRACEEAVVQAPAPERLIKGGCRRRRWSPTCWCPNTPGTCRSIGKRRFSAPRASTSHVQSLRSGLAMRLPNSPRFTCECAN
jgi:transposase